MYPHPRDEHLPSPVVWPICRTGGLFRVCCTGVEMNYSLNRPYPEVSLFWYIYISPSCKGDILNSTLIHYSPTEYSPRLKDTCSIPPLLTLLSARVARNSTWQHELNNHSNSNLLSTSRLAIGLCYLSLTVTLPVSISTTPGQASREI